MTEAKPRTVSSLRYWALRLAESLIAVGLAFVFITLMEYREDQRKLDIDAADWWQVNDIFVPDHEAGSNPNMIYDRTILHPHRGFWVVEAQRQNVDMQGGVFGAACTGSGVNDYDMEDVIPGNTVTWAWFFGRPCAIPPGVYRLQLTKDMTVPDYPVKSARNFSNVFRVYEPGTMPVK